ncbi:MAG TPA: phosphodiesterase [Polyangiaceae bacterium]|nr:phosphodiesterase [Polyangiaceae bacterium]
MLGVQSLILSVTISQAGTVGVAMLALHGCTVVQSMALTRPDMRPLWYRALVSQPDAFFQAGTLLSFPWAIAHAVGHMLPGWWAPYLLAAMAFVGTWRAREETVDLVVADGEHVDGLKRHPDGAAAPSARPLRIGQITDPHLGTFMSANRLARICERLVAREPDLVFLTGDFLTMESQKNPHHLAEGLAPLRALEGRCFACLGNHDLEAPETVRTALAKVGVSLLVDDAALVDTPAGAVQILGADFRWRMVSEQLAQLCREHPRVDGALRILMLHAPSSFSKLPEGEADLVLSGHTHGGQIGLVRLGLKGTIVSLFGVSPDHGFWARGTDRLYVHRGTGHYGFPLRIGVPGEESLVRVHRSV